MTALAVVALAELVVIAGLALLVRREADRSARTVVDLTREWAAERSELLNRIQRPTWLAPPRPRQPNGEQEPAGPPDEIAKIGTVAPPADDDDEAA